MKATWLAQLAVGWRGCAALAVLLLLCFALAAGSAAQKSVTVDEYQALPHGLAILKTGDFHLATGVPVLPSVLAALPLLGTSAVLDPAPMRQYVSSWQCGKQFLLENIPWQRGFDPSALPGAYHDYFLLGRLVSIATLLLVCGLAYGYARSLYGAEGGLIAAACACLSPNLLAHGRLVTPDVYLTAAVIAALWASDALLRRPGWETSLALGLALGLAALSKLTGLLLFLLLPMIVAGLKTADWLVARRSPSTDRTARNFGSENRSTWLALVGALILGMLVINLGYLCDGACTPLRQFDFQSPTMKTLQSLLPGWLGVPLPKYFFLGIDEQLAETGYEAYLLGEFNTTGFWSYYLVGLLVKTPVPVLLLCGAAWFWGGRPGRREVPLLATAALLLLFFSLARHKNIGLRYVLFLEPMMAVWIGRLAAAAGTAKAMRRVRWCLGLGVSCLAAVSLTAWPDYLPYFNWASGGPDHGHSYLLDSNLDWGQDLIGLRRYLEQEGIEQIDLAYYGRVPPEVYGIRYRPALPGATANEPPKAAGQPFRPQTRHVAISANFLWGRTYLVNGDARYWLESAEIYKPYRRRKPKAIIGHTIYVFELGN
ncbi:MAG TPA: glycosyltransferase family 39 protein [Pirellulales bacterium]|nr:glycosyltransferase family 39 protein [Pirellulales bacterium]